MNIQMALMAFIIFKWRTKFLVQTIFKMTWRLAEDCGETIRTLFNEELSNISGESGDESWGLVTVSERSYYSGSRVDVPRISTLYSAAATKNLPAEETLEEVTFRPS